MVNEKFLFLPLLLKSWWCNNCNLRLLNKKCDYLFFVMDASVNHTEGIKRMFAALLECLETYPGKFTLILNKSDKPGFSNIPFLGSQPPYTY